MALTLQQKLEEAEEAYHNLLVGTSARVVVDMNGERVEYTATNRGALASYIAELRRQIAGGRAIGPLRVWF